MIVNNLIKSAWIATKSGINPRAIVNVYGNVIFTFPTEERFFELRRQADNMSKNELVEDADPCVIDYLKNLVYANKQNKVKNGERNGNAI